jgi:hypothetical protein
MAGSRWVCPHCEHAAFITDEQNVRTGNVALDIDNAEGRLVSTITYIVCPNPSCKKTTVSLFLGNGTAIPYLKRWGLPMLQLRLLPRSYARPIPDYVPEVIRQDYFEACAIVDLSPKAAATLARRALQGMIRDFHGITRATLYAEIEALKGLVDPTTWQAINVVRSVGNIGAHMEKDINLVIDVEPDEAVALIRLIEMLISEWYVARQRREEELSSIVTLGQEKQAQRGSAALVESSLSDPTAVEERPVLPEVSAPGES